MIAHRYSGLPIRTQHAERGSVLVILLWVCLGLVSMTLVFGHTMTMALRGSDNELAGRQAEQAIEGAARYAQYLLANLEEPGQLPSPDSYETMQVPVGEAFFWFLGRPTNSVGLTEPVFGLIDEASKLNLNTATQTMLEGLPGMTAELAAAIVDWRDEDDDVTEGGAESETYLLSDPAYTCKNGRFETVEELLLVHGADWTILYGEDANQNGVLDPNENDGDLSPPEDNADGVLDPGILDFLTVYSRETNQRSDGSSRINVNSAPQELATLIRETFDESRADDILRQLGGGPQNYRSLLEFFIRSRMTADEFDQVYDALTTSDEASQEGLVNVNTASDVVLACIPGLDESTAAALAAQSQSQASSTPSIAWVAEVLEEEAALRAGPYLTARTSQVTADIAALGRHGRGYRRARFVIDFSGETPQVLFRKDLDALGWALGTPVYEALAMERKKTQ